MRKKRPERPTSSKPRASPWVCALPNCAPKGQKLQAQGNALGQKQNRTTKKNKNMAQSLCKVYLHIIFHVKSNGPIIKEEHLERVHQYIGQIVNTTKCKVIRVGGISDHVHALCQLSKEETISHLVEEIKRNSSRWIKSVAPRYEKFSWQSGYAVFSVSQSVVDATVKYIDNQYEHHKKVSFKDEYLSFLKLYNIEYDERYVFAD